MPAMRWIDADAHILEQQEVFARLDARFRDRVEILRLTKNPFHREKQFAVRIDGMTIPCHKEQETATMESLWESFIERFEQKFGAARASGMEPATYLEDLDREQLERVVIYPTIFLHLTWLPLEHDFSVGLARAYNDYIHDFCSADPRRLRPVAVISPQDMPAAVAEVERAAKRGFVGIFMRPNPVQGHTLGDPYYRPLYAAAQELGMSIGIHEGTEIYLPTLGADRARSLGGHHIMCHPFEQMAAMASLVEWGTFEEFPRLNYLFLEAGAGWAPFWVKRLDAERKQFRQKGKRGALPSEIFERQCYVGAEMDDESLPHVLAQLGDRRFVVSTDYPHDEATYPHSDGAFRAIPISEESRERLGRTNTIAAYPRLG
jgi:predicted TIM-barrel fold metal-dependent hydrolase